MGSTDIFRDTSLNLGHVSPSYLPAPPPHRHLHPTKHSPGFIFQKLAYFNFMYVNVCLSVCISHVTCMPGVSRAWKRA